MGTVRLPTPIKRKNDKSQFWWLRKKVPQRLRSIVGQAEVWRSLGTPNRRAAAVKCAALSAELEAEWCRLAEGSSNPAPGSEPAAALSHRDLVALAGIAYRRLLEARSDNPGTPLRWIAAVAAMTDDDPERERLIDDAARDFLAGEGARLDDAGVARFLPHFVSAQADAYRDLERAARGDYSPSPASARFPALQAVKVDLLDAFRSYCDRPNIKGRLDGPTAKRWKPVVEQFARWLGHRDLARVTAHDAVRWRNYKLAQGIAPKAVRDVWLAALRSISGFMVNELKLNFNAFAGVSVDGVKAWKEDDERGFDPDQSLAILSATVATPSHLMSVETRAARRWVPWICAYTGARVNEITSLLPADVGNLMGVWCFVLRPEITKGKRLRRVPVHRHLIEQGLLEYIEARRRVSKPLFYEPARARGGKGAHPQWQKVAERLAEWVTKSLKVTGVQPNHGWRHLFRELSRGPT